MDEENFENENEEAEEVKENDAKNTISADLIRGHINTIILRTLNERDKYGYEIINEIEEKSHGQYTLKQPTLYSALKRLESQGYVKSYWKTDSVTLGGRRKYFTLTESGKEIAERNQAEWEYSRTVIDSLISDKSFDFNQPAPTAVDFNLLKKSVTRVPTQKDEDELPESELSDEQVKAVNDEQLKKVEYEEAYDLRKEEREETIVAVKPVEPEQPEIKQSEDEAELQRKIAHENFLKLISAPTKAESEVHEEPIVPHSEDIDTNKLLYNNKPETERDYKNLINGIYSKAIKNPNERRTPPVEKVYVEPKADSVTERGIQDGLKVNTSKANAHATRSAAKTTYDLGMTLFKCSLIVAFILLIEFIICITCRDNLGVSVVYPIVILLIGLAQLGVCGFLALKGFGKNAAKPTTHGYVSICIIITIIAILIISVAAFLMNVNFASGGDICAKIVIPCITALNVPVFALSFYFLARA